MPAHRDRRSRRKVNRGSVVALALIIAAVIAGLIALRGSDRAELTYDEATRQHEAEVLSEIVNVGGVDCVPKKNVRTYLIMGVDNTASQGENYVTGGQCDVLVLLVVDHTNMTYYRVPINRNTMCQVHSYDLDWEDIGSTVCQIALAYAHGDGKLISCENAARAVSDYLYGAEVDHYIALDLSAIPVINRVAGGVTVTIEDDFSAIDPTLEMGKTIKLTDAQAEIFVRSRMRMIDDDTNEARMRRQEAFMDSMRDEMFKKARADATYALDVYDTLEPYMVTNMNGKAFSRLVNALTECEALGSMKIDGSIGTDSFGYATFEPDPTSVRDAVIELFYRPAESGNT